MQNTTLRFGELEFPMPIIEALKQDRLVVFAGAGVSMGPPANLMNFNDLTQLIIHGSNTSTPSDLENQIQDLHLPDSALEHKLIQAIRTSQYRPPEERLGEAQDSGRINIHAQCQFHLKDDDLQPNSLHTQIIRLFADKTIRIITTNFEGLFEKAANDLGVAPDVSIAPNLPQGDLFKGIVHLHGSLKYENSIILSDRDFGRAYLSEGWARRFITRVFANYTVLFIGYSYNDTIMKYLARSISQNPQHLLFGISSVTAENQLAEKRRWELLGMTHIPYTAPKHNHQALNQGIKALANSHNWNWKQQNAQVTRLVKSIEKRPVNLTATDWKYLHYIFNESPLLSHFLSQIKHPHWPNILEQLQQQYPNAEILYQPNTTFVLFKLFWQQSASTMMRLFQSQYTNTKACQYVLHAIKMDLEGGDILNPTVVQQWLHLLLPHIKGSYGEYHSLKTIAPFLIERNCHTELALVFKQLFKTHVLLNSTNPSEVLLHYNIEEYASNELLHPTSSFMQLSPITILEICLEALKHHSHLSNVFTIQARYDSIAACYVDKPCIWEVTDTYHNDHKIAYHLIDVCRLSLIHPQMPPSFSWSWVKQYLTDHNPLLQKLAVWIITHHPAHTADTKFTLLLNNIDIHELVFHAEIFDFFKHCLAQLSDGHIQIVINSLETYPDQTIGQCVRWAFWLKRCHTSHPLIDDYYEQQKTLHTEYQLPENPYRHVTTGDAVWITDKSPYTSQILQAQQTPVWFDTLFTYEKSSWDGSEPSTEGLWKQIAETSQESPTWAMALFKHGVTTQQNADKLNNIISKFGQWHFKDSMQWNVCFDYFLSLNTTDHTALLCNILDQTHRNIFFQTHPNALMKPDELATKLIHVRVINAKAGTSNTYYSLADKQTVAAYNSNIGYVTQYLIAAFSQHTANEQNSNLKNILDAIQALLNSDTSGHTIHLLMTKYNNFEHYQPNFSHSSLLPYLNTENPQHQMAWMGYFQCYCLTPTTHQIIEPWLKSLLINHIQNSDKLSEFDFNCLRLYVWSIELNYHNNANDSINWLNNLNSPLLSKAASKVLTSILESRYQEQGKSGIPHWMLQYWQQRRNGLGGPFDAEELEYFWEISTSCPDWMPQIFEFLMLPTNLYSNYYWLAQMHEIQNLFKPNDLAQWAQLLNKFLSNHQNLDYYESEFIVFILNQDIDASIKKSIQSSVHRLGIILN